MQLRGLLYRKLREFAENRRKAEKRSHKEHKTLRKDIDKESDEIIGELEVLMKKDAKKAGDDIDSKFDQILKNLETLNRLNKTVIKQNQVLMNLLKKKKIT